MRCFIANVTINESLWEQAAKEGQSPDARGKAETAIAEEVREITSRAHEIFLMNGKQITGTYNAEVHLRSDAKAMHIILSPTGGCTGPTSYTTVNLQALRGDYFAFANNQKPISNLVFGEDGAVVKGDITRRLIIVAAHALPSLKTPAQG